MSFLTVTVGGFMTNIIYIHSNIIDYMINFMRLKYHLILLIKLPKKY